MNDKLIIVLKSTWVGITLAVVALIAIMITSHLGIVTMPYRPYILALIVIITIVYCFIKFKSYDGSERFENEEV